MVAKAFHYSKFEGWEKVCIIQYCPEVYYIVEKDCDTFQNHLNLLSRCIYMTCIKCFFLQFFQPWQMDLQMWLHMFQSCSVWQIVDREINLKKTPLLHIFFSFFCKKYTRENRTRKGKKAFPFLKVQPQIFGLCVVKRAS